MVTIQKVYENYINIVFDYDSTDRKKLYNNDYFAAQCKIIDNGITLPEVSYRTITSISYINITSDIIVGIINKMRSKKQVDMMRTVFLDISKAFDEVQHKGIIYKPISSGMSGNLLNILRMIYKIDTRWYS